MKILQNYKDRPKQAELAKQLGCSEAYVSMLLKGKRNNPEMLKKLEQILKDYQKAA